METRFLILVKTKFKGIVWLGVRTKKFKELCVWYEKILGLRIVHKEKGFRAYDLLNGDRIELFSERYRSHQHFKTGPVVGFLVDDIEQAKAEMESRGIKFIGPIHGNKSKWAHFKGPDGNIYEITVRKPK